MADEKKEQKEKKPKKVTPYKPAAKFCPKCGCRMADHKDRFSCGACKYTEWKKKG